MKNAWDKLDSRIQNAFLLAFFYAVYLFVNISIIPRSGYHWDETLDFQGGGFQTYVAAGRWALGLWKSVFGMGCSPWTAGLCAGLFLAGAAVWQIRMFGISDLFAMLVYGIVAMSMVQFSRMLEYSVMSDAVACGLLAATASAALLTQQKVTFMNVFGASVLLAFAMGIYQNIGAYQVMLLAGYALSAVLGGGGAPSGVRAGKFMLNSVIVLVAGCSIYVLCRYVTDNIVEVQPNIRHFCDTYQSVMLNNPFPHFDGVMQLGTYVAYYSLKMLKSCFVPTFEGEWVYITAIIPVIGLLIISACKLKGICRILWSWSLVIGIWVLPFIMILALGNEWPCRPHTRISESTALAILWGLFLQRVLPTRWVKCAILLLLGIWSIRASHAVSAYAKAGYANFEKRVIDRALMLYDAHKIADAHGLPEGKGNILYFSHMIMSQWNIGVMVSVDFSKEYPTMQGARTATPADYEKFKEHVDTMPIWPRKGSIKVVDNTVLIKGYQY